jgi:gliding motility-associated-like protein
MTKISQYIKIVICLLIANYSAYGQTADNTAGCSELKVEFTAPPAASHYWVFGDGANSVSTLQNPVHSYLQPGTFTAQLFDQEGGTQIGQDITIIVYRPISFDIDADIRTGCAPIEVNFSSTLDIDPAIDPADILDIVWTFGDGNTASGVNVSHTYPTNGTYNVSVKVITTPGIKCDEPVIFEDYIKLEGESVTFNLNQTASCDVPDDFVFTNTTDLDPGSTLFWDFGNGQTTTEEGPHTITYDSEGVFMPSLTITSASGCESTLERTISIGAPTITPTYPDTVCLGAEVILNQSTIANFFTWDFSGAAIDSSFSDVISILKRPKVIFTEPGFQTFQLTAVAADGCATSATLDIFVSQPNADYTVGPEASCGDPILIEFSANDGNQSSYIFNPNLAGGGEDLETTLPNGSVFYDPPNRDEFYINTSDTLRTRLIVTSSIGCLDTSFVDYPVVRPEAFFIPDVVKGCIPFEVNFSDLSVSEFEITNRSWNFGDGNTAQYGTTDTLISHVFNTRGRHEVVLTITDASGCVDISRKVEIIAIEKIEIPGIPVFEECPPLTVCVEDEVRVNFNGFPPGVTAHIESDDGRFDHCWTDPAPIHTYQYPGIYEVDFTWEFLTIFIDSVITGCVVEVIGSRSDIDYFIDCSKPFEVVLNSEKSINADQYTWYVEDQMISTEPSLTYTFDERGEYMVYLETSQNGTGCRPHRDSALIYITDVIAEMTIPAQSCVSVPSMLDATASQDVHNLCRAGYTWVFEDQRPREVDTPTLDHNFLPGFQEVLLIVEDINGCQDTTSASTTAYDLQAEINADTLVCLPTDASLVDLSFGDTTIVAWDWDFGGSTSTLENPEHEFNPSDYDPDFLGDTISVQLVITDAIGCVDTTDFIIGTYDILSAISMDNGPIICQNGEVGFAAADYNLGGSFLTYEWDFGFTTSTEDTPSVVFTEAGDQIVTLVFTEDATGCQGTLDTLVTISPLPEASFTTNQDSVEFICFPEQIEFTNTSNVGEGAFFLWDFDNGEESIIENPTSPFGMGTFDVELIVISADACSDTIVQSYTLVGPEGDIAVDIDVVCPGQPVTFTLLSPVDVSTFTWDFGDGTQVDDENPVTHTYDTNISTDSIEAFTPALILRSDESGCELDLSLPIDVSSITAGIDTAFNSCPGQITLASTFDNPQSIEWVIDGQVVTGTSTPSVSVDSDADSISVTLMVVDANGCAAERAIMVANPGDEEGTIKFPNVFSPNGDMINPTFNIVYDDQILTQGVTVTEFKVYNRWGEILYDNANPDRGWDGRYEGLIVPADVYGYFIEVSIDGCLTRSKKGNVTVIK